MKCLSSIRTIKEYVLGEICILRDIVDEIAAEYTAVEDKIFVNVPQINKKFSRKTRVFNIGEAVKRKCLYRLRMFYYPMKYEYVLQNILRFFDFCILIKERENISVVDHEINEAISDCISKIDKINECFKAGLETETLSRMNAICVL